MQLARPDREGRRLVEEHPSEALPTGVEGWVGLGRTSIRVTGAGGSRSLPVQVYDPRFLDTEELTLAFTDSFTHSGMTLACNADAYDCAWGWQPLPPDGFFQFGTYFTTSGTSPSGTHAVMVVKPRTDTAVRSPDSWIFNNSRLPIHRAVCPDGYKALGEHAGVAYTEWTATFACVRADLTSPASVQSMPVGGTHNWSLWKIVAQDPPAIPGTYFNPGTYLLDLYSSTEPSGDPAMNVLKVNFGLLDEAPPQVVVPRLTSLTSLAGLDNNLDTAPTLARAMLVPCTAINDTYWPDLPTRVKLSPFYRLEQQVFYRLKKFFYNQTSLVQEPFFELTKGISTTETTRFETEAGITISYEAGVKLDFFEAGVTTSLSLTFGYSTETSVQELQQETTHIPFSAAPGKATAVWRQYNRFVLYRHNGTAIEQVGNPVEIGTSVWVVDEYPD